MHHTMSKETQLTEVIQYTAHIMMKKVTDSLNSFFRDDISKLLHHMLKTHIFKKYIL